MNYHTQFQKTILSSLLLFGLVFSSFSQERSQIPLLEVSGSASKKVAPDRASFFIQLEEKAIQVTQASEALNKKTTALSKALQKTGIRDYRLVADNYAVSVNRTYHKGSRKDSGYVARQQLQIRTETAPATIQKIITAIESAGDMSYTLQYEVSPELKQSVEEELIKEALQQAARKATLVAETMGIKSLQIHHISFGQNSQPMHLMNARMDMPSTEALIAPDSQEIRQEVHVKYTY